MIDQKLCFTCNTNHYREQFHMHSNVCNYCRERGKGTENRINREISYLLQWVEDPHHCQEFMSKVYARMKVLKKAKRELSEVEK